MDDDEVGQEQARGLCRALAAAGIEVGTLWLHCFRMGGNVGELEVDAYLHHALGLPRFERDLLAHAANELMDHGPGHHAPYSTETLHSGREERTDDTQRAEGDGGPDDADQP